MISTSSEKLEAIRTIVITYSHLLAEKGATMGGVCFSTLLFLVIWQHWFKRERQPTWFSFVNRHLPLLVFVTGFGIGLFYTISKTSLFDDAYISLRYARNMAEGYGLVFNPGERVEGYTNFLWTFTLGILIYLLPVEPPMIAIALSLLAYAANLVVVFVLSRRISRQERAGFNLPLAVLLMGFNVTITDYGTTGLETACASLFVNLGLLFLLSPMKTSTTMLSGLMFILATLTRPDHAIFFVAGGVALFVTFAKSMIEKRSIHLSELRHLIGYAAPFTVYGAYILWKYIYYGDIVPNTYYTKMVAFSYVGQGLVYASIFYLANHFWVIGALFLVWLFFPANGAAIQRFKVFTLFSVVVYHGYIIKIGGDFMHGRFFVPLIPLMLLSVENLAQQVIGNARQIRRFAIGALIVAVLSMTAININYYRNGVRHWNVSDESAVYRVTDFFPVTVSHFSYPVAIQMKRLLTERGLSPIISTHGIGMVAYYTRLVTIDQLGLTDSFVSKLPVRVRSLPGHEKVAPLWYLRKRGAKIGRLEWRVPIRFGPVSSIVWGPGLDPGWSLVVYDRQFVSTLRNTSPEIGLWDFEAYLDDYIAHFQARDSVRILEDLKWFEGYYFNHNDDTRRYDQFLDELERFRLPICRPVNRSVML